MKALARVAIAAAALAVVGAAAGAAPGKVKLTVAVSGSGGVTSSPAGIDCKPTCAIRVRKGLEVVLTATPTDGAGFSHWSAPCGQSPTCTVRMSAGKTVHAFFKAAPPPPPPPPPPAQSGSYAGTYSDGTFIKFDVGPSGISLGNITYDLNGHCSDGGTSYGEGAIPGPFAIENDGSFSGTYGYTLSNATGTATINGRFSPDGSASGTLNDTFTFTSGESQGSSCTTSGTWTANVQP